MYDLKGIEAVMGKLKRKEVPGELIHIPEGRAEIRYEYNLGGEMVFTFGLTRSSKAKSKRFPYVHRQMKISGSEYAKLYECPWKKKDYNNRLVELGIVPSDKSFTK
jgi:hypothetical protein